MNDIRFDQSLLIILYFRYKAYIIPGLTIFGCLIIFIYIVFPQIQTYVNNKDVVARDRQTIQILQQNSDTLLSLNQDDIAKNTALANEALPPEKDFSGILNGISQAASDSNVQVGNYTFNVGNILNKQTTPAGVGQLSIGVTLSLSAGLDGTQKFITALDSLFPLSEVSEINTSEANLSQITANFYYHPIEVTSFNPTIPVPMLSFDQQSLMNNLSANFSEPATGTLPLPTPIATTSAQQVPQIPQ